MQVLGDPGAFLFHGSLVLDALTLPDLDLQFGRALFDAPVQLSNPKGGGGQHAHQHDPR